MFDLYLLVTPFFGLLSFLTLLNLKFTLTEPKFADLHHYRPKKQSEQQKGKPKAINRDKIHQQTRESKYLKALKYLIQNFTLIELCLVRRSRNKIPILLSLSLQAILSLIINSQYNYIFSCLGLVITMPYLVLKIIFAAEKGDKNDNSTQIKYLKDEKYGPKLDVFLTSFTLLINLAIIWLVYHNTKNQQILASVYSFSIIIFIDNLILKPLLLCVFAFPLKFWSLSSTFIDMDIQISEILHGERTKVNRIHARNEIKKNPDSTSNTENTLEIEPCVNFDINGQNIPQSNIQKRLQFSIGTFISQKKQQRLQQNESALVKYINYPFKNIQLNSIGVKTCKLRKIELQNTISKKSFSQKNDNAQNNSIARKRNKLYSEKIGPIPQFTSDDSKVGINVENQEQQNYVSPQKTGKNKPENRLSTKKSIASRENYMKLQNQEDNRRQKLRQIDPNSPQVRRNSVRKIQIKAILDKNATYQQNQARLKFENRKNYKKFSLDSNNYLDQKQNICRDLIKKSKQDGQDENRLQNDEKLKWQEFSNRKKSNWRASQIFLSRKSDVSGKFSNDSRMTKSLKRTRNAKDPIVRQNNQNEIPEFIIEDFIS